MRSRSGTLLRPSGWRTWWLLITPAWVRRGGQGGWRRRGDAGRRRRPSSSAVALLAATSAPRSGISALAAPTWADGLGPRDGRRGLRAERGDRRRRLREPASASRLDPRRSPRSGRRPRSSRRSRCSPRYPRTSGPTALSLTELASRCSPARSPVGFSSAARSASPARARAAVSRRYSPARSSGLLALVGVRAASANGRWSDFGTPPLLLAGIITAEVLVIALAVVLLAAVRRPRPAPAEADAALPRRPNNKRPSRVTGRCRETSRRRNCRPRRRLGRYARRACRRRGGLCAEPRRREATSTPRRSANPSSAADAPPAEAGAARAQQRAQNTNERLPGSLPSSRTPTRSAPSSSRPTGSTPTSRPPTCTAATPTAPAETDPHTLAAATGEADDQQLGRQSR